VSAPQWTPEITVDAARAHALIAARFPDVRAERLERLGQGWDNAAYLVDDTAVFRFPQRAVAAPLIETEIAVLPAIAQAVPVPVPVPRWIGEPDATYPWHFAGYPLLAGTPLDTANPGDAARDALAQPLAAFLRALHALDSEPLVAAGLPRDTIGRMDPGKRIPQVHARVGAVVRAGALHARDAAAVVNIFVDDAPSGEPERLAVVHGDLYARHLLLDEDRALAGVIDWGDVHLGDPAVDLSVAHEVLPASAHAAFLAAYGEVSEMTWRRARWRAIHHAVLVADYGIAIGDAALARGALDALARILAALRAPGAPLGTRNVG
jgi:aminoglycoside phosphotransferase (APT) family kinase protein